MFAHGATGAGKTYTMSGNEQVLRGGGGANGHSRLEARGMSNGSTGTDGLIPRSMQYLFQKMANLAAGATMRIRASFYEIYNEVVYDLLAQMDRRPLQVLHSQLILFISDCGLWLVFCPYLL